jgi:hypothetical protein
LPLDVHRDPVFKDNENRAILVRNGIPVDAFNFVSALREVDNTVTGITVLATEVTEQVLAKQTKTKRK